MSTISDKLFLRSIGTIIDVTLTVNFLVCCGLFSLLLVVCRGILLNKRLKGNSMFQGKKVKLVPIQIREALRSLSPLRRRGYARKSIIGPVLIYYFDTLMPS